jgi:hypothetical protein
VPRKGSQFERDLCPRLSLWWTGDREDVFWRTDSSGGRAKRRARDGKATFGKHGDICAVDPLGLPLIRCITFEAKNGYPKDTFADLLEKSENAAEQEYEKWINQVQESARNAGTPYWLVVFHRTQRSSRKIQCVLFPTKLFRELRRLGRFKTLPVPFAQLRFYKKCGDPESVVVLSLDDFMDAVRPRDVRTILRRSKK